MLQKFINRKFVDLPMEIWFICHQAHITQAQKHCSSTRSIFKLRKTEVEIIFFIIKYAGKKYCTYF